MPIRSVDEVIEASGEIADRMAAAVAFVTPAASIEDIDAQSLAATTAGVIGDCRALLAEMDTTIAETLAPTGDPASVIALWEWRRLTRRDVVLLLGEARGIQDLALDLVAGQRRKVVVTRQGDTLQRVAARELGDWREWPRLLAANPDVDPGELPSGLSLVIPERR